MKTKMFNAFSLQMLPSLNGGVVFREITATEVTEMLQNGVDSYIGHADTARVISKLIGIEVPAERKFGKLTHGEQAIIAQVMGGRLPEGATELPPNMEIKFVLAIATELM